MTAPRPACIRMSILRPNNCGRFARLSAADEAARAQLGEIWRSNSCSRYSICRGIHIAMAHFGILGVCPASLLAKFLFKHEPARALFAGIAAHSFLPLEAPVSSAFGLVLGLAGHAVGWPIPRGGSQQITNALADLSCVSSAGKSKLNHRVDNLNDLPKSRARSSGYFGMGIFAHRR